MRDKVREYTVMCITSERNRVLTERGLLLTCVSRGTGLTANYWGFKLLKVQAKH